MCEACGRRVDENRVLAEALDLSGLTFSRRSIGQATLCTLYVEMSVAVRNIGAEAQTWVPRDIARIKEGRGHGGNQRSNEKAEESTHFR